MQDVCKTSDRLDSCQSNENESNETSDQVGEKRSNDDQQKETIDEDSKKTWPMSKIESESGSEYVCYAMTTFLDCDNITKFR